MKTLQLIRRIMKIEKEFEKESRSIKRRIIKLKRHVLEREGWTSPPAASMPADWWERGQGELVMDMHSAVMVCLMEANEAEDEQGECDVEQV